MQLPSSDPWKWTSLCIFIFCFVVAAGIVLIAWVLS